MQSFGILPFGILIWHIWYAWLCEKCLRGPRSVFFVKAMYEKHMKQIKLGFPVSCHIDFWQIVIWHTNIWHIWYAWLCEKGPRGPRSVFFVKAMYEKHMKQKH